MKDAATLKQNLPVFERYFPNAWPTMGWYFTSSKPDGLVDVSETEWSCMFRHIQAVTGGQALCFSAGRLGCSGAACYLGFQKPAESGGRFLADKEKFKKSRALGEAFYRQIKAEAPLKKYLVLERLDRIADAIEVEVVNCWVNPLSLAGLVTLANFDSPGNNNVMIPFAAGCQSMWTIPYSERNKKHPKAVVGAIDPAVRKYIEVDTLLFSAPAHRFHEMAENIELSFAVEKSWLDLVS